VIRPLIKFYVMKRLLLIISALLLISGCEKDLVHRNFEDDPSIPDISGKWTVVSYEDIVNNNVTVKSDVDSWNDLDVMLTFTKDSLYGWNTTNSVVGKFQISGRDIHVTSYGGTKIGQPEWGNMFSDVIYMIESFKINESQLRFYYKDNRNSVTLNRSYQYALHH
jgi:hypothetical protein